MNKPISCKNLGKGDGEGMSKRYPNIQYLIIRILSLFVDLWNERVAVWHCHGANTPTISSYLVPTVTLPSHAIISPGPSICYLSSLDSSISLFWE